MGTIRTRLDALEQQVKPSSSATLDLSTLSDNEFVYLRNLLGEIVARAITQQEAEEMLARPGPYPLRTKPFLIHPELIRVRLNDRTQWIRFQGFPGYSPEGWERYLRVGPDGVLARIDGATGRGPAVRPCSDTITSRGE